MTIDDTDVEAEMNAQPEPPRESGDLESISRAIADLGSISDAMDGTVAESSGAMGALRELLRRLEALAVLSQEHQRNEAKIGQLFTRVQDYIDRTTAEAEEQARALIAEAEFEASRIVTAAKEEAHRLITDASRPTGIPPEAIRQLQVTIEGFARLNADLLRELAALNETLNEHAQPVTTGAEAGAADEPPPPPPVAWAPPPPVAPTPPPPPAVAYPPPPATYAPPPPPSDGTQLFRTSG